MQEEDWRGGGGKGDGAGGWAYAGGTDVAGGREGGGDGHVPRAHGCDGVGREGGREGVREK